MRRKGIRVLLIVALFASLGLVTYKVTQSILIMKAREIKKNPAKLLDYVPEAALQIKEFRRAQIEDGRKVWEVSGEEASYVKEAKEVVIKKPRVVFYDRDGTTIEATGNDGRVSFTEPERGLEKMQLQGGVQVNYRGFLLQTDQILYVKSKNQVILPGKVTVKGDGLELEGVGMEIALDSEKLRLNKNVKTRLQPDRLKAIKGRTDAK